MDEDFQKSLAAGSASNVIFVVMFFIIRFIQARCKKSQSSCHTGWFDCTTELEEMKRSTETVRDLNHQQMGLLSQIQERLAALETSSKSGEEGEA